MTDSVYERGSMIICDQPSARVADVPVMKEKSGEREQAPGDASEKVRQCVGIVALQRELDPDRLDHRPDPLAHAAERAKAGLLVLAVRAQGDRAEAADQRPEVLAGNVLVGNHRVAGELDRCKNLGGDLALRSVDGSGLEADRGGGAEQIEPEAPEAAVGGPVAAAGWRVDSSVRPSLSGLLCADRAGEAHLGLLPGSDGTQRLTKLIVADRARPKVC